MEQPLSSRKARHRIVEVLSSVVILSVLGPIRRLVFTRERETEKHRWFEFSDRFRWLLSQTHGTVIYADAKERRENNKGARPSRWLVWRRNRCMLLLCQRWRRWHRRRRWWRWTREKRRRKERGSPAHIYTFSVCYKRGAIQWEFVIATTQTE